MRFDIDLGLMAPKSKLMIYLIEGILPIEVLKNCIPGGAQTLQQLSMLRNWVMS